MNSGFADFLAGVRRQVDQDLEGFITALPAGSLRDAMAYSVLNGGKRVRPALCYAAAQVFAPPNELTRRCAAALELVHAYSLIHDDLPAMDDDDLRRGKPTCHIAFDEATAILAGDALQALAFEILADSPAPEPGPHMQVMAVLARAAGGRGMVLGQAMDLSAVDRTLDRDTLETMHRHKTGALISASIAMGAISSGGATDSDLGALASYGAALGLAFQVKDDILDVESPTETLGKTQGADHARNKPTYTSILGLDGARARLRDLQLQAEEACGHFGGRGSMLEAIAHYVVHRTY